MTESSERLGQERRIDDAYCLIPFLAGTFSGPSQHALLLGSPLLQYTAPEINLRQGRWTLRTVGPLGRVKKAMDICRRRYSDAFEPVDRNDQPTLPIVEILRNLDAVDAAIVASLEKNAKDIAKNATYIRMLVVDSLAEKCGNSRTGAVITESLQLILKKAFITDQKHLENLPLAGSHYLQNESFNGLDDFAVFVSTYLTTNALAVSSGQKTNRDVLQEKIEQQETNALQVIINSIKAYRALYGKLTESLQGLGSGLKGAFIQKLTELLRKTEGSTSRAHYESSQKEAYLDRFIEALLVERIELLHSHVHTYFSAVIGRCPDIEELTRSFVESAVITSFSPLLDSFLPTPEDFNELFTKTIDRIEIDVTHAAVLLNRAFFVSHLATVFEEFKITRLTSSVFEEEQIKIRQKIDQALWRPTPPASFSPRPSLTHLNISSNLIRLKDTVEQLGKAKLAFIAALGKSSRKEKSVELPPYIVDKARDTLVAYVHELLAEKSDTNPAFAVVSHVIYANQRANPAFAAAYLFPDIKSAEARKTAVKKYLFDIASPFGATNATGPNNYALPAPLAASEWNALASAPNDVISKLRIEKLDGITALTQAKPPKQPQTPRPAPAPRPQSAPASRPKKQPETPKQKDKKKEAWTAQRSKTSSSARR